VSDNIQQWRIGLSDVSVGSYVNGSIISFHYGAMLMNKSLDGCMHDVSEKAILHATIFKDDL
jgi:hypothetical protein